MNWWKLAQSGPTKPNHVDEEHLPHIERALADPDTSQGVRRWYDDNNMILNNPSNPASISFFNFVDSLPWKTLPVVYRGVSDWMISDIAKIGVYHQPMRFVSATTDQAVAATYAKQGALLILKNVQVKDAGAIIDSVVQGRVGRLGNSQHEVLLPQGDYRVIEVGHEPVRTITLSK